MTPEFQESIKRSMQRLTELGITCRPMTEDETNLHDSQLPQAKKSTSPLPFAERVKQTELVRSTAKDRGITIVDACDIVGISFSNYKSVRAAMKKGITKRP